MKETFKVEAQLRTDSGKGASRRLRREAGLVPAVVYGGRKKPESLTLNHNELQKHLDNEAFYSHIITLDVAGSEEQVILKDLQRHPAKPVILHVDFFRVSKTKKFNTRVPLHFINEEKSVGVKTQGGVVTHTMTDLEITCLPADLPEFIEVDMTSIEVGGSVHISDLVLPSGVESIELNQGEEHDLTVASISVPRAMSEASDEPEAGDDEKPAEES